MSNINDGPHGAWAGACRTSSGRSVVSISFPTAPPTRVISRERGSEAFLGPSTQNGVLGLTNERSEQ